MDALTWGLALAAGVAAGTATGLLPGLHTNTLAALLLALAPGAGEWGAHALLAAVATHAFVTALPATYVGVPGDDATLSVLPAHRLLQEGRGPEAVRIAADATLVATMGAVLVLLPYKWILKEPGRALEAMDAAVPWILASVLALLVFQERRKGLRGMAAATLCLLAAGVLGWLTGNLRVSALVPLPATPLLPLLSGLFGAAGLVHSATLAPGVPPQEQTQARLPLGIRLGIASACARGVAAAGWTAALPGLTSAVGASVALAGTGRTDPRIALACMNAVGAAHQVFALAVLWLTLRSRTGTAIALQDLSTIEWWTVGRPPVGFVAALATLVAASALAHVVTIGVDRLAAQRLLRTDARRLSLYALAFLVLLVVVLSGPMGLLVLGAATTVGLLPLALGVRRVHLTAALIVPILLARLVA